MCVHQTWVVLVATTLSTPAPTPILSARVRPPLRFRCYSAYTNAPHCYVYLHCLLLSLDKQNWILLTRLDWESGREAGRQLCVPTFILGLAKESVTSIELNVKVNWHDATSTCWPDAQNSVSKAARTFQRLNIMFDRLLWGRISLFIISKRFRMVLTWILYVSALFFGLESRTLLLLDFVVFVLIVVIGFVTYQFFCFLPISPVFSRYSLGIFGLIYFRLFGTAATRWCY
jgi:hypothetical protein